jgi:hypothetical protein
MAGIPEAARMRRLAVIVDRQRPEAFAGEADMGEVARIRLVEPEQLMFVFALGAVEDDRLFASIGKRKLLRPHGAAVEIDLGELQSGDLIDEELSKRVECVAIGTGAFIGGKPYLIGRALRDRRPHLRMRRRQFAPDPSRGARRPTPQRQNSTHCDGFGFRAPERGVRLPPRRAAMGQVEREDFRALRSGSSDCGGASGGFIAGTGHKNQDAPTKHAPDAPGPAQRSPSKSPARIAR